MQYIRNFDPLKIIQEKECVNSGLEIIAKEKF